MNRSYPINKLITYIPHNQKLNIKYSNKLMETHTYDAKFLHIAIKPGITQIGKIPRKFRYSLSRINKCLSVEFNNMQMILLSGFYFDDRLFISVYFIKKNFHRTTGHDTAEQRKKFFSDKYDKLRGLDECKRMILSRHSSELEIMQIKTRLPQLTQTIYTRFDLQI